MENLKEQQKQLNDNNYCVRKQMFFVVTNPIIEKNLTKEEADKLCKEFNHDEMKNGDGFYVHYEVHYQYDE